MICSAFGLIIYNGYVDKQAGIKSKEIYDMLQDTMDDNSSVSNDSEEKTILLDGNEYIGIIDMPTIDIKLPIMDEWDYKKMKIAPCKYYGSIYTDDLIICAHSYKNLFRYIKNLKQGDKVVITDLNNREYVYEVEIIEILAPEDVSLMIDSEFDLTLFTCTNDNQNRITVRLNKI